MLEQQSEVTNRRWFVMSTSKWTSVITNAGKNLLSYISEQHLVITKAECGDTRTEGSLEELTGIQNPKDMVLYPSQSIESNLQFRITLSNQNILTGFSLYQIGIYAKLENQEDDVLFMVIQAAENQPDIIPSNQESPNYVNDYVVRLIVANTNQITVQVTADAYATTGVVLDLKTELKSDIQSLQNTKLDVAKLNVSNGAAGLDESGKLKQMPTASDIGAVPIGRTVNSKPLSSDIVLNAADTGAVDVSLLGKENGVATLNSNSKLVQMPTASDVGAVPTGRTINGKPLSANVALSATDVGAVAANTIGVANGVASLNSDGKLVQMPTFDDFFVSGEWTPQLHNYLNNFDGSYTSYGYYYKFGKLVYVVGRITITNPGNRGNAYIDGLPFETDPNLWQQIHVIISTDSNLWGGFKQQGSWVLGEGSSIGTLGADGHLIYIDDAGTVYSISGMYISKE